MAVAAEIRPPPLEEMEVVYGELVAQVQPVLLHPVPDLLDGVAQVPLAGGIPHQQPLAQGGAQGVHSVQPPVGILGAQLLHGQAGGVVGGGQAGGEGQNQHILPSLKQGLQGLGVLGHIDRVGGGHLAAAQAVIEDVGVHVPVVGVVVIGVIGQDKGEGENLNIDLPDQVGGAGRRRSR